MMQKDDHTSLVTRLHLVTEKEISRFSVGHLSSNWFRQNTESKLYSDFPLMG